LTSVTKECEDKIKGIQALVGNTLRSAVAVCIQEGRQGLGTSEDAPLGYADLAALEKAFMALCQETTVHPRPIRIYREIEQ